MACALRDRLGFPMDAPAEMSWSGSVFAQGPLVRGGFLAALSDRAFISWNRVSSRATMRRYMPASWRATDQPPTSSRGSQPPPKARNEAIVACAAPTCARMRASRVESRRLSASSTSIRLTTPPL